MMNYRGVLAVIATLVVAISAFIGCTTEVDYTLGSEFVPTDQKMEMHHRLYKGGKMYVDMEEYDMPMTTTRLYQTDSIKSSNLDNLYFGHERSTLYGTRKAGFMTQMLFGSKLNEEYGWGYRPIFDSMQMALYVTEYHGDTTHIQRYNVHEIISNDYLKDSTFYINFSPEEYISKEPIFTFDYPNQKRGVYVGDVENPVSQYVTFEETEHTAEYVSRLMFTTNLDDNEGYGKDTESIYEQGNEDKFTKSIRGIYITPADEDMGDSEGAMFATDSENSALVLYARSRYAEDPTIIKDTTIMSYNFFINPNEYKVKAGNFSINMVDHTLPEELTNSIEQQSDVQVSYVDGMGGVVTEVSFTDEFIQSLADIALSKPSAIVSVNQAKMRIYLEGSNYDYLMIDPFKMAGIMDMSMPLLGLYTRYGGTDAKKNNIIAISDYHYSKIGSIDYDGTLNRSLGCYTMEVSTHIQSLMMAAADNVDENGKVKFEKFDPNSAESDPALVSFRRFYVAPAADNLFGLKRQAIFGGDDFDINGAMSDAPITLELTYTVVY